MFSQSADEPAVDQSPAPIGMRELPPQPAKPVMPAYASTTPEPTPQAARPGPGAEDSVIAKDDHLEGTFTSRGTVVVMGSVKGRIEAVQVRIEDGAHVDADVLVDEAIIAGEFSGNLTCRERLEAHASGRINGRVETFKLMLHEGASVEGEMHMLTGSPKDASETIRGSAPLRGEARSETASEGNSPAPTVATAAAAPSPSASASASTSPSPSARSSASTAPSSRAKPANVVSAAPTSSSGPSTAAPTGTVEASSVRSSLAQTLQAETAAMRVAPRATTTSRGYGSAARNTAGGSRNGSTTTGF